MSIFTEFHLNFHHKFLFVFLHWYSSHSLDFTSVYDFSFAKASVFERLRKHNWYFCLSFCIDAADTQSRFYICLWFHLCNSIRFWTFMKYENTSGMSILTKFHNNFHQKFLLSIHHNFHQKFLLSMDVDITQCTLKKQK